MGREGLTLAQEPCYLKEAARGDGAVPLLLRPHVRRRQAQTLAVHLLPEPQ